MKKLYLVLGSVLIIFGIILMFKFQRGWASLIIGGYMIAVALFRKKPNSQPGNPSSGYESPHGFHRHKCDYCNHIWEHSNKCGGITKHHECPKCGREEWSQYHGTERPSEA